jgi:hypothetical protein
MKALIRQAPDEEMVVRVASAAGNQGYYYIASALEIILSSEDFGRFGINGQAILRASKLDP